MVPINEEFILKITLVRSVVRCYVIWEHFKIPPSVATFFKFLAMWMGFEPIKLHKIVPKWVLFYAFTTYDTSGRDDPLNLST